MAFPDLPLRDLSLVTLPVVVGVSVGDEHFNSYTSQDAGMRAYDESSHASGAAWASSYAPPPVGLPAPGPAGRTTASSRRGLATSPSAARGAARGRWPLRLVAGAVAPLSNGRGGLAFGEHPPAAGCNSRRSRRGHLDQVFLVRLALDEAGVRRRDPGDAGVILRGHRSFAISSVDTSLGRDQVMRPLTARSRPAALSRRSRPGALRPHRGRPRINLHSGPGSWQPTCARASAARL